MAKVWNTCHISFQILKLTSTPAARAHSLAVRNHLIKFRHSQHGLTLVAAQLSRHESETRADDEDLGRECTRLV